MTGTKQKLIDAAVEVLRTEGITGASARVIADKAGVNQALVFYHFETVTGLIDRACRERVDAEAATYRERFEAVTTLRELLDVGRTIHAQERATGNVTIMAQVLAGAQNDPALAETSRYALGRWTEEIERTVIRVLAGSPLDAALDPAGLARAVSASFVGLILYDGVDPDGSAEAFAALDQLGRLVGLIDNVNPAISQILRSVIKQA